jgi:hypothetical protein
MPGFATPSEAFVAVKAGAKALKLYPAGTYGFGHIKAVRDVLPKDIAVYAVGGVGAANLKPWIEAGVPASASAANSIARATRPRRSASGPGPWSPPGPNRPPVTKQQQRQEAGPKGGTPVRTIDFVILAIYAVAIFGLAQWVSRDKGGKQKDSTDYFLAGKALPWWAIGASLIAANISAEQIIGMSGSGYALGLAIASYEWMAALTLLIVGKFFLPIFLKNNISTMPQFLEQRYGPSVRNVMAVFWLVLYVFVNLTSILWLGSIAIHTVTGIDQMRPW